MRIALTHKFVAGSLVVAATAIAVPEGIRAAGWDFSAWGSVFVALLAGGARGFSASRVVGLKVATLGGVTERIRAGDLRAGLPA
ncbi:MAG: hypothetical protein O7A09_12580, partial [Proteobacteria bacterium]|nr:hypothetical protein [Pseudomonadota bacterium]